MSLFRTLLLRRHCYSLLKSQNINDKSISLNSVFRTISSLSDEAENHGKARKPLAVLFQEAVEISPRSENCESESKGDNHELKKGLRKLEEELRSLKSNENFEAKPSAANRNTKQKKMKNSKAKGLYDVFTNQDSDRHVEICIEDSGVHKELSPDIELFVSYLFKEGYVNKANFVPLTENNGKYLDFTCLEDSYGRGFIKHAAELFAKDNQEIAKWVSGSELKKVAQFGCPSLSGRGVFSAKRLRRFFEIPEDTVCNKCVLKPSCKFANQNVWNENYKVLDLVDIVNVITLYALEAVPSQLVVPDEVKASISLLMNEVVSLSQTSS